MAATIDPPIVAGTLSVEVHGINPIPDRERWAKPRDVFALIFGGANSLSAAILGTFPAIFGLSFWDGLLAIVVGVVLGSIILSPMGLFGPRNGTNNAVSSSAHFGAHGRMIGSLLALLGAFTFIALAIWASGDALLASLARILGFEVTNVASGVIYVVIAILLIIVCVFGYRLLVMLNRFVPPLIAVLFVVGIAAYAVSSDFQSSLAATPGGQWSDPLYVGGFFACALIAMSSPISYGPFLGDYTRYVPRSVNRGRLMFFVAAGGVACLVALIFGHVTATAIAFGNYDLIASGDYVGGLILSSPTWFFIPLALISIAGGLTTGTGLLYGTGLDLSSIVPRLRRVPSTLVIGTLTLVFVIVGKFVFNMVQSVTTLSTLIVICTVPWMVVMMIGYFTRRAWYDVDALQVFNRRQRGGLYWYQHGWNPRAVVAWALGAGLGLLFVNLPGQFVGLLSGFTGGVDVSLLVALVVTAIVYAALLYAIPEQSYLYGTEGARAVPTRSGKTPAPIVDIRATRPDGRGDRSNATPQAREHV